MYKDRIVSLPGGAAGDEPRAGNKTPIRPDGAAIVGFGNYAKTLSRSDCQEVLQYFAYH